MWVSILLQGAWFWARDAVTPSLPSAYVISDAAWLACFISLFLFKIRPKITVLVAWLFFLTVGIVLEPYSYHEVLWFFERTSLAILNVLFGHLGLNALTNTK